MELKQHLIHRNYKKCEAKTQIAIGDDYSVPDGKPDVAGILQKKAELQIDEVHTEKGKIRIAGKMIAAVLYVPDRSSQTLACLDMEFPFNEILYMEGAENGDNLKIDWTIDEFRVNVIHPGKLSARALVTFLADVTGAESHLVAEDMEQSQDIYTKTESYTLAEPIFERNDSYRIRDEVILPVNKPNIQQLLWKDLQLRGLDIRIQEGKLVLKGELLLFVVYEGEEEPLNVQWMEQTVPFHGTLDVTGLTGEMFGTIKSEIAHQEVEIKPDYDGEMRMLQLGMLLNVHMHIYEERTSRLLKDAYSTKEQLILKTEEMKYQQLGICSQTKCRISGSQNLDTDAKVLQILGHQAQIKNQQVQKSAEGLLCEGNLEVQVMYVTGSDRNPFGCIAVTIPYRQQIEIPDMAQEDQWSVDEQLEQLFITMSDSHAIEVRGVILFGCCVMKQCCLQNVTEVTAEPYDQEAYQKLPGMRIHFVQPGETLWGIAKESRGTIEDIRKLNDLAVEEIVPGQKLLLLKKTGETIL